MERKYFTLIVFFFFCFLLSCGGGSIGDDYSDFDSTLRWGVAVDDLDLDGAVDIALTFTDTDGNSEHFTSVFLNDLNFPGSFFLSDEFELKGSKRDWPTSITLGDLNDDGYSDIATQNGEAIFILFQDPTLPGQFFVPLKIKVGEFSGSQIKVLEGLRSGEIIVTAGVHKLQEGVKVRIAAEGDEAE